MKILQCILTVSILFCGSLCNAEIRQIEQSALINRNHVDENCVENALVTVTGSNVGGVVIGCGFVIGDGSLVVTAAHNLFDAKGIGKHKGLSNITVLSPYLGKAVLARIIALDTGFDLAILHVGWEGHPALMIPSNEVIRDVNKVEALGLVGMDVGQFDYNMLYQSEQLSINHIIEMDSAPALLEMNDPQKLKTGWSGAPIVVLGTNQVIGCFTSKPINSKGQPIALGTSTNQISSLLQDTEYEAFSKQAASLLPQAADGHAVYSEYLRCLWANALVESPEIALESGKKLIKMRPMDAVGYYSVGDVSPSKLSQHNQARYYQLALEKEPENMAAKLKYANFLRNQNKLDQSEIYLHDVLKAGYSTEMVTMCLAEIYLAKNRPDKLDAILTPRLKQNPFNGYLWYFRSKQYQMMSRNKSKSEVVDYQDESIAALNKAIELLPSLK
jgi:tetratricopeptide (TPR) repeat protein